MCSNSAVVDCAVGSGVLGKRGYNLSSTQSMVLFHVKCVMLQAVYTTAEKEFRTIVLLIF